MRVLLLLLAGWWLPGVAAQQPLWPLATPQPFVLDVGTLDVAARDGAALDVPARDMGAHDVAALDVWALRGTREPVAAVVPATPARLLPAAATARPRSGAVAVGLSLLLPGLGQRYASGTWSRLATAQALADVGAWAGLVGTGWAQTEREATYEALAASRADAAVAGKSRGFFLTMSQYASSADYRDALERARRWDLLPVADDPANYWAWASEADLDRYRTLRNDAEALSRQRPFYGVLLVTNRLVGVLGAVRATRRANQPSRTSLTLTPGPTPTASPQLGVRMTW